MYLCVDSCCAAVGKNSTDTSSAIAELFVMFLFFLCSCFNVLNFTIHVQPSLLQFGCTCCTRLGICASANKKTCVTFRKCFHRQEKSDCYLTLKQLLESVAGVGSVVCLCTTVGLC